MTCETEKAQGSKQDSLLRWVHPAQIGDRNKYWKRNFVSATHIHSTPLRTRDLSISFKRWLFNFSYDFLGVHLHKKSDNNEPKWKDFQDLPPDRTKFIQKHTLGFLLYSKLLQEEEPWSTRASTKPGFVYTTTVDNPTQPSPNATTASKNFSSISNPGITVIFIYYNSLF